MELEVYGRNETVGAVSHLPAQQARIEDELRRRLDAVLAHCQFVLGPEVAELERDLAQFCGAKHCVSVSSGTDALQIAMMAEHIGRGDAVFLPAFTYTATAEVPLVLGATPVFVDVDPRTFQIDPVHLRQRIGAIRQAGKLRPRAVIGVDLFGQPADWPALLAIAVTEGLLTIDDLAQSFGASLHGRPLGSQADVTATSFFPSKPLGAYGDGGALFTESDERADLYRSLRTHGEGKTRYEVLRTGMNGRLRLIQAAVLLAKLTVFPEELVARRRSPLWMITASATLSPFPPACPTAPPPGQSIPYCCRKDATEPWCRILCAQIAYRRRSIIRGHCIANRPIASTMMEARYQCPTIWPTAFLRCPSMPTWMRRRRPHVCDALVAAVASGRA